MAIKKISKIKSNQNGNGGAVLSAEELFEIGIPIAQRVELDELNGKAILIRALTAADVISFLGVRTESQEEQQQAMVTLIQKAVVNPDGTHMFPSEADVLKLQSLRFPVFTAIANAVGEIAGLNTKKADKVEEVGKAS